MSEKRTCGECRLWHEARPNPLVMMNAGRDTGSRAPSCSGFRRKSSAFGYYEDKECESPGEFEEADST